ncbi:hypothetical protein M0D69_40160 [Caballeronia sp. SEWSISQ10-4 2]|uniref:hypothetical protein n=1 Tax=Caballeronia sp. SEWSISQ10-4 2 TaxID=2937438 RepID=UPI00264EAC2B|nr:hypothetical protein [Caballeronia sp. SEWSISQ10-4 2]MDN7184124.1 hypothetical protein [Caballeronia sp. SEWSISQ10-4 2]
MAFGVRRGRRQVLRVLAALAGSGLQSARAAEQGAAPVAARPKTGARMITQMIGANGWASAPGDVAMWKDMGITWGRDVVGPGQGESGSSIMDVDKTSPTYISDLPPAILANNRNGIHSLLLLGFTPWWNATVPKDSKSAPKDVRAWERYVEAAVRKYSAPPYNVKYFQVWNEAAGKLSGGLQQATFWHGPDDDDDGKLDRPYERAMQDYVERIHIPAARIIRKYKAYVVYGGWPDQGGLDTFTQWLEYRSPTLNERMLDCVDYLDFHYLNVDDLSPIYDKYVKNGPARGIWQTEIGDRFIIDPFYLPRYFFDFAVWALERNWDDPDKYVSTVYHWDGYEPFRLTHRGPPRTYNVSGRSLVVLRKTLPGALAPLAASLKFSEDASGSALYSGSDIVVQVSASTGWRTVEINTRSTPASGQASVAFIDALTGVAAAAQDAQVTWNGSTLSVRFKVPQAMNGAERKTPAHLAYLVVRSKA